MGIPFRQKGVDAQISKKILKFRSLNLLSLKIYAFKMGVTFRHFDTLKIQILKYLKTCCTMSLDKTKIALLR